MHEGKPVLNIYKLGAMVHRRLVYIHLLYVPSFTTRYFNKIKQTSRLGRLLALSLEILTKENHLRTGVKTLLVPHIHLKSRGKMSAVYVIFLLLA